MASYSRPPRRVTQLTGRSSELSVLDRLIGDVRAGQSRVLVVSGEPGVGKTALLDYALQAAAGLQVVRAAGVESEMELAFAGLHQLCTPIFDRLNRLPVPQRDALRTAFGLSAGPPPDRFRLGLAVLGLLSEAAEQRAMLCLVDDEQWLDRASARALAFVARRLDADPVGLILVTRVPGEELARLPGLAVEGLRAGDAQALLDSVLAGPLDARVREQIVAETRGNPLALLELPRRMTPTELAGGFGLPGTRPLAGYIEDTFGWRIEALPAESRHLLLLAAADPSGDTLLVWRAAAQLEIPLQAATVAAEHGLAEFGARVRFRHPLVRSAAYRLASPADRREAHRALAEATDPQADPDRRAWHRAQAAARPDEEVAAELERSAGRAQTRGGLAAAAAFADRAALLTPDPDRRSRRLLAAAQASLRAGDFGMSLELLAAAEAGPLDELHNGRADLLRGQLAFASGAGSDATPLLVKAARRLELLDLDLARETYLEAWRAAAAAGYLAGAGDLLEVSYAARALPRPAHPRPADLLLDGLALLVTDGPAVAAPVLRQATRAFARTDIPAGELLRWNWMIRVADQTLWDHGDWAETARQVQLARDVGALDQLPNLLNRVAMDAVWSGDLTAAASLVAEAETVREATRSRLAPFGAMMLAAFRGREAEAVPLIQGTAGQAAVGGQGAAVTWAHWAAAVLRNGLRRYDEALAAARRASEHAHPQISMLAWPELIEAVARTGNMNAGRDTLDLLARTTQAGGTDLGLGIEARSRALLSDGDAAEGCYLEAIGRLSRTRLRPDLARAHLLYGEWLRRENRRAEAREQLRAAHEMLDAMGMEAFAERARRELLATGETVRKRAAEASDTLTAQEAQVARLARNGLSNPEIGARLFISSRTVQYHLHKVFTKLGITARSQLHQALLSDPGSGQPI